MGAINKKNWLLSISLGVLGFLIGSLIFGALKQTPVFIPPLKVVGDVSNSLQVKDPKQMGKNEEISYDGKRYPAIRLRDIIDAAKPVAKASKVYLVGSDGFTSSFKAEGLEKSYIAFTARNGWEAINLNHPVNSNAKMLKEIIVVSDGSSRDFGLRVINQDSDLVNVTPGQLYTRAITEYPFAEGKACVEKDGRTYETEVYTKRRVFKLSDLTPVSDEDMILVMGEKGEYRWVENRGYFELKDNYINYLQIDERSQVERVKGVIIAPPPTSIMDTYYDVRHFLESGEKVLVIVLDGFTYHQYAYAVANGYVPFLQKMGRANQATAVYPPESNVCWAAMITGKAPEENGIINAHDQNLQVPSLFTIAQQLQKKAILLQVDQKILKTGIEPVLCSDKNSNGTADDELYATTLAHLDQGTDLLMVRFQGIAASREQYGDLSQPTLATIAASDKYLEAILNRWHGKVIITATADSGNQPASLSESAGDFSCNSLLVPYWRLR